MREYHLWEKDCRAYFLAMALKNDDMLTMRPKGSQSFTGVIHNILTLYAITMPVQILDHIERMRERINIMKHEAGLELDHFVTEGDYTVATDAIEGF